MEFEILVKHGIKTIDHGTCHPDCQYLNNKYSECKLFDDEELKIDNKEYNIRCDYCRDTTSHIKDMNFFGTREIYEMKIDEEKRIDEVIKQSKEVKPIEPKPIYAGDLIYTGNYHNKIFTGWKIDNIIRNSSYEGLVDFSLHLIVIEKNIINCYDLIYEHISKKIKEIEAENEFL